MKNRYKRLKLKLVLYLLIAAAIAFIAQQLFGLVDIPLKDLIRDVLSRFFTEDTLYTLKLLYEQFYGFFLAGRFFLILFLLFYFIVSRVLKYFNQISDGMDKLLEDSEQPIILMPELDFLQEKLNKINYSLKEKKRAALESEQRKNDLVVYLAHDLKTPLTSVIGYLNLLDEAPDMPAEQRAKYIGITLEKANRLEELINEFFEITRFNLESIVLNKSKINLPYMLMQMADEFYPMLAPKGRKAVVHVPDGLTLNGDADKLARVFNNILKNAIAYSDENSVIDISASEQGKDVVITFTNQGNPIPPQKLETIFEKFYRMDSARTTNTGGAGLGLAIAKEIVTAHGGTVTAESNEEHTVFTVKLPS